MSIRRIQRQSKKLRTMFSKRMKRSSPKGEARVDIVDNPALIHKSLDAMTEKKRADDREEASRGRDGQGGAAEEKSKKKDKDAASTKSTSSVGVAIG